MHLQTAIEALKTYAFKHAQGPRTDRVVSCARD
jgi:hypothetical protein